MSALISETVVSLCRSAGAAPLLVAVVVVVVVVFPSAPVVVVVSFWTTSLFTMVVLEITSEVTIVGIWTLLTVTERRVRTTEHTIIEIFFTHSRQKKTISSLL